MKATLFSTVALATFIIAATPAVAQETAPAADERTDDINEILVTATKKGTEERAQDVPVAITAFGSEQLRTLNVRDISDLNNVIPNAVLDGVGTFKGVAGFSIRGNPQQDSIPTIDPTVGTFIDGVYLGVNAGVIFDTFDLGSIEILRGPQGILFGRNVVGGAVVINTKRPSEDFTAEFNADVNSGLRGTGAEYMVNGVVSGPLTDRIQFKVGGYYNRDEGWFENLARGGENFGASRTWLARAALAAQPSDTVDLVLRYEHGDIKGDGTVAQSQRRRDGTIGNGEGYARGSFDVAADNVGANFSNWDQVSFETNIDVGLGDNGQITNIFGYRRLAQGECADFDATAANRASSSQCLQNPIDSAPILARDAGLRQRQFSNELRYYGRFSDVVDVTAGLYYFTQKIDYAEMQSVLGGRSRLAGGGLQDQDVYGAFLNLDADVTDRLTLSLGGRFTHESKSVEVTKLTTPKPGAPIAGFCNFLKDECPIDFADSKSWNSLDVKIGAKYEFSPTVRAYAHFTTATRAGGYSVRVSAANDVPGPVDPETLSSFELGIKTEPFRNSRFNLTGFYSMAHDLQRTVIRAVVQNGVPLVAQTRANTADATIWGIEAEGQFAITDRFSLTGTFGYTNASYDKVIFDLSGDGLINDADLALKIPRTPKFTYSVSASYDLPIGSTADLSGRVTYSHVGSQFASDANLAFLPTRKTLDFNLAYRPHSETWDVALYGKNILNQAQYTSDLQLPAALGSTYTTIKKGRQFGVRASLRFH